MKFGRIDPNVRFITVDGRMRHDAEHMVLLDNRIIYIESGSITLEIDGENHNIFADSIVFVPAGQVFKMYRTVENRVYFICFDFTMRAVKFTAKKMSVPLSKFDKSMILDKVRFYDYKQLNSWFVIENAGFLKDKIVTAYNDYKVFDGLSKEKSATMVKYILCELVERISSNKSSHDERINIITEYIDRNYSKHISNDLIAEMVGYHPYFINSVFKTQTGMTIHRYLTLKRITVAKQLLVNTNLPISEIASQCGYSSGTLFSNTFLSIVGERPVQYRKNHSEK